MNLRPAHRGPAQIRFACEPADKGVIAPPVAAKTVLPDWFRKLPAIDADHASVDDTGLTIKRCMPFLDAMSAGWIIPLAADVRLEISGGGTEVVAGWDFDRVMVSNHAVHQIAGSDWQTPRGPRPPRKFHNYWTVTTPPGVSCLIVPPLNRPNGVFEILSGVVDTDRYRAHIHFPFVATGEDGLYALERGTPIAQIIPFRRADAAMTAWIGAETAEDRADRQRHLRSTRAASGWYRTTVRDRR